MSQRNPDSTLRTPRRPRISEDETRRRLLDLASERLASEGLGVGLDAIRMERLIEQAGVSRASAYRCWPHRDDFLADALVETLRRTTLLPETPEDVTRLLGILEAHRDRLGTEQGRRDLVVEAFRISIDADVRRMVRSPRWRLFMALSVTAHTLPAGPVRTDVESALATLEREFVERRALVYGNVIPLLGYRLREPWQGMPGLLALSEQAGLVVRGIVSRALVDPGWLDERTSMALFGSSVPADWSAAEVAGLGVLLNNLEPDPSVVWDADHLSWAEREFAALAASLGTPTAPADTATAPVG